MERLPQEIVDRIASFALAPTRSSRPSTRSGPYIWTPNNKIEVPSIAPTLATLSLAWKASVEAKTFRELSITNGQLQKLEEIITGPRRSYLRNLEVTVVLPKYSREEREVPESDRWLQLNNETFTTCILQTFLILKKWEDDGVGGWLDLSFRDVYCPTDYHHINGRIYEMDLTEAFFAAENRYKHSWVRLLTSSVIPTLKRVTRHFSIRSTSRNLTYESAIEITKKVPFAKSICWDLNDPDAVAWYRRIGDEEGRKWRRLTLAGMIALLPVPPVKTIELNLSSKESFSPKDSPGCVLHANKSGQEIDPLSEQLRELSMKLENFFFEGTINETLFWPKQDPAKPPFVPPTWPYMRRFYVTFSQATPCGHWYLKGHQGLGEVSRPNTVQTEYLRPLLFAFAKAAMNMPKLQVAMLKSYSFWGMDYEEAPVQIAYTAPGVYSPVERSERVHRDDTKRFREQQKQDNLRKEYNISVAPRSLCGALELYEKEVEDEKEGDLNIRRVYWKVGTWLPEPEIEDVFAKIGEDVHGEKMNHVIVCANFYDPDRERLVDPYSEEAQEAAWEDLDEYSDQSPAEVEVSDDIA